MFSFFPRNFDRFWKKDPKYSIFGRPDLENVFSQAFAKDITTHQKFPLGAPRLDISHPIFEEQFSVFLKMNQNLVSLGEWKQQKIEKYK